MHKITGVQNRQLSLSRKTNKFSQYIQTTFKDDKKTSPTKRSRNLQSPLVYNLFLYASFRFSPEARGNRAKFHLINFLVSP